MIDYIKFSLKKWGASGMIVKKLVKGHYTVVLILIVFLLYSPRYVLGDGNLKTPNVIITLEKVFLTDFPSANLDVSFTIYNPNNVNVSLEGVVYSIYINQKFVGEQFFVSLKPENPFIATIAPNETKIIRHNPVLILSSIDEEVKNLILEGTNEWDFTGTAVFSSSLGDLKASVITEKTKVRYEGGKFPLLVNLSTIRIEVRDENWIPIADANVTLISKETSFEGITNETGSVEFEVPTTNYTVKVSKEGYVPHEQLLELSIPSTIMRAIQLYPSARLTIEINDEAGNPLRDVNVTFASDVGNFTKTTDASGIAEFEIPRANYTLTVSKKGYLPHKESLDLSKSTIESKVIQLTAEIPWWQQYWYLIAGVIAVCIVIPVIVILKMKRKRLSTL
ncbi:MAG: carboxypeptidase-like regulatory domain-containing protein [Candidatus Aenigmarchaeota archaeon]|nr:carboxypeptidase-like regulatory domain-containing protein [Candidatus Aenigmarchaeota archaeon]